MERPGLRQTLQQLWTHRVGRVIGVRFLLFLTISGLFATGCLDRWQRAIEDTRFSVATRGATGQLLLVDIDEPSIKALGTWPWSRATHAAIVDRLTELGAAEIAFDVDFSSPSHDGDGDAAFAKALQRADDSVILAALQQEVRTGTGASVLMESRPLPAFAAHSWEASVNLRPDRDGKVRELRRGQRFGSTTLPSLSALVATESGRLDGAFRIDYGIDYGQLSHVSVSDLLHGALDASLVRDRKVIVGASAVELRDIFQVPRFGFIAGSAVQAMAAESILQKRTLEPVGVKPTLLLSLVLLGFVAWLVRRLDTGAALLACSGLALLTEACATAIQAVWPIIPITAAFHAGVLGLAAVIVLEEIISRRRKLIAARRGENRLRTILDRVVADNFAGIVVVDQAGQVCASSFAAGKMLGCKPDGFLNRSYRDVLPLPLSQLITRALADLQSERDGESETCEVIVSRPDQHSLLLDCVVTVSDLVDAGQSHRLICLTFRDITEERDARERLLLSARTDALSGLPNRSVLLAAIEERVGSPIAGCFSLIFFDIDRFKYINDRLGHEPGDALLRAVAQRLRQSLAETDVAARLGGDEFAVLVHRTNTAVVEGFAADLALQLGGTYDLGAFQPSITVSLGVAFLEDQTTSELMSCADAALRAAKATGGDAVRTYDAAMAREAADKERIAQDLRLALQRHELEVVYQRQVDAVTERIIGVEALVRWRHPERGYIPPTLFVPIAERTGLIEPIGAWVLAKACEDAVAWCEPIKVSVNLSAVQLARASLADLVFATLDRTGLDPKRLDLELTESLLQENDDVVLATLGRLRAAEIKISLDDFGTGYSSLSYLNRFAIDKVKIDRSFVQNLHVPATAAIVRAVVGMAHEIGLRVNAEGVETREELVLLQRLGCHEIQGYLHGRPDSWAEIEASLMRQATTSLNQTVAA